MIFFDGVCNLCNASVQFILKRDRKKQFLFASLQSDFAKSHLPESYTQKELTSIVLMDQDVIATKSTAALLIARRLEGFWRVLYYFIYVPKFLRNTIYDFIASNRYRWFGRQEQCMIPSPQLKSRFLD